MKMTGVEFVWDHDYVKAGFSHHLQIIRTLTRIKRRDRYSTTW